MAPKKLKKTKNSKKNNNNNTVPNVEEENSGPVLYSIDDIPTHIQLLKCEQEDVKTKVGPHFCVHLTCNHCYLCLRLSSQ